MSADVPLPAWAAALQPVDMAGAARVLGISRRTLVDVIKVHRHYEARGNRKVFYPEHIEALKKALGHGRLRPLDPRYTDPNGFIYIVEAGGLIKIGFTRNVKRRIHSLRTASASPLSLLFSWAGTVDDERKLHHRFAAYRSHREWFRREGRLADYIEKLSVDHGDEG